MSLQRTWLVQRLHQPFPGTPDSPLVRLESAISGAGLCEKANKILAPIFRLDYMGAAEFEWGAIPKSLVVLIEGQKELIAFSFEIKGKDVKRSRHSSSEQEAAPIPDNTVYALCHRDGREEVEERIRVLAKDGIRLKERTLFPLALGPSDNKYDRETVGWMEINNHFFWFLDKKMWEGTCALFGVKP